jgi:hypothetical protein
LFHNLGSFLLATVVAWFYFWVANFMVFWYSGIPADVTALQAQTTGFNAPVFWLAMLGAFFIPFFGLLIGPVRKSINGVLAVSSAVVIGILLNRYLAVAPGIYLAFPAQTQAISWIDFTPLAGALSGLVFLYLLFARFLPILSIWAVKDRLARTGEYRVGKTSVEAVVKSE